VEVEVDGASLPAAPSWWRGGPDIAARLLDVDAARAGRVGPDVTAACLDLGLSSAPEPLAMFGMDAPLYLSTHCPPADLAPAGRTLVSLGRYVPPGDTTPADVDKATLRAHATAAVTRPPTLAPSFSNRKPSPAFRSRRLRLRLRTPPGGASGAFGRRLGGPCRPPVGRLVRQRRRRRPPGRRPRRRPPGAAMTADTPASPSSTANGPGSSPSPTASSAR
jgi:hypothetical protein